MEQVMETVRETGSRVLDALCETGKAVVGFFTGLVKSVSCSAAKLVKDSTCKAAGCTWDKAKQVAKEYRQVLLIVAAGVSAALAATAVVFFFGSTSLLARNTNLSFAVDLVLMAIIATVIYSYLFKKTSHNVLYVLLAGTVLSTFFTSMQTTLTRIMDPNEYDSLLASLVASFTNVNTEIIFFSLVLIAVLLLALRRELALLDVITLGKAQAINLGVDYDRTVRRLLLGVTLFIAIATAMVGPISFLGLIIANLSRQLFKTFRHSYLIAGSALIGMVILAGGQLITEQIFTYSVPVSVFITVGGGIYFLYLLLRTSRSA